MWVDFVWTFFQSLVNSADWVWKRVLGIRTVMHSSYHYWVVVTTTLHYFQGLIVGALLNMPLNDVDSSSGLKNVSFQFVSFFLFFFFKKKKERQLALYHSPGQVSLPDCRVSYPISWTSFSDFRFIRYRWNWNLEGYSMLVIYIREEVQTNNYRSRIHLRIASSRLFKSLNTNWALLYRLHTVKSFTNTTSTWT